MKNNTLSLFLKQHTKFLVIFGSVYGALSRFESISIYLAIGCAILTVAALAIRYAAPAASYVGEISDHTWRLSVVTSAVFGFMTVSQYVENWLAPKSHVTVIVAEEADHVLDYSLASDGSDFAVIKSAEIRYSSPVPYVFGPKTVPISRIRLVDSGPTDDTFTIDGTGTAIVDNRDVLPLARRSCNDFSGNLPCRVDRGSLMHIFLPLRPGPRAHTFVPLAINPQQFSVKDALGRDGFIEFCVVYNLDKQTCLRTAAATLHG